MQPLMLRMCASLHLLCHFYLKCNLNSIFASQEHIITDAKLRYKALKCNIQGRIYKPGSPGHHGGGGILHSLCSQLVTLKILNNI